MKSSIQLVAAFALFTAPPDPNVWTVPACNTRPCEGTRIRTDLGFGEFCVPRGLTIRKEIGEHGDVHYTISRSKRSHDSLLITSGPYFTGKAPGGGRAGWLFRPWKCDDWKGEDFQRVTSAGKSRYLTLNMIMGYAQYSNTPPNIAATFDRILDSFCCRGCAKCPPPLP